MKAYSVDGGDCPRFQLAIDMESGVLQSPFRVAVTVPAIETTSDCPCCYFW